MVWGFFGHSFKELALEKKHWREGAGPGLRITAVQGSEFCSSLGRIEMFVLSRHDNRG